MIEALYAHGDSLESLEEFLRALYAHDESLKSLEEALNVCDAQIRRQRQRKQSSTAWHNQESAGQHRPHHEQSFTGSNQESHQEEFHIQHNLDQINTEEAAMHSSNNAQAAPRRDSRDFS
eukprot:scpid109907/ scgid6478/ 